MTKHDNARQGRGGGKKRGEDQKKISHQNKKLDTVRYDTLTTLDDSAR